MAYECRAYCCHRDRGSVAVHRLIPRPFIPTEPTTTQIAVAASPVDFGVLARCLQTHEIHTSSGCQIIRIKHFQAGN